MNEFEIQSFATYAYSQESRGFTSDDLKDPEYLSKFGVGAKQAGFYLGDTIDIYTKKADNDDCLSFLMDKERFANDSNNTYKGVVLPNEEPIIHSPSLKNLIVSHRKAYEHFTVIILTLNSNINIDSAQLVLELEEIFHFQLHSEHREPRVQGVLQPSLDIDYHSYNRNSPLPSKECLKSLTESKTFQCFSKIDRSNPSQVFSFKIKLHPSIHTKDKEIDVHALILYFGCQNGEETNPYPYNEDRKMIRVYWQYRYLPEAVIEGLPIFPTKYTLSKDMARLWDKRVQIYLFFDRFFEAVSNNKLKLLVNPNYLNQISHTRYTFSNRQLNFLK
jgi:hypothetical protein